MTQTRREQLSSVMMGDSGRLRAESPRVYGQLDQMIAEDVLRIEPLIDEWILEAFREGKRIVNSKLEAA